MGSFARPAAPGVWSCSVQGASCLHLTLSHPCYQHTCPTALGELCTAFASRPYVATLPLGMDLQTYTFQGVSSKWPSSRRQLRCGVELPCLVQPTLELCRLSVVRDGHRHPS